MQNSDSANTIPKLGQGLRYIDWVSQGWQGGCARIESWFTEHRFQPDEDSYLRVVMQYVTYALDNMAYWNRYAYIWAPGHVEDPYLKDLRKLSDKMYRVAEAYAKAVCDPTDKPGYLLAVRTRLDSRIHFWEGEARAYVRDRIAASLAGPQQPEQFELLSKVKKYKFSKLKALPGSKLRIAEGIERVRAKWFSSLEQGGGHSRAEIVGALSDTLDVHAETYLPIVKDEKTSDDFCELLRKIGVVLIGDAFENGRFEPDIRADVELRFESRYSYWRAEALKLALEKTAAVESMSAKSAQHNPEKVTATKIDIVRRRQILKQYRLDNGLKMADLARRGEISVTAIQGMVRSDRKRYSEATLTKFLNVIGVTADQW